MDGPHLIYFSDPMCSWCYGFSTVTAAIRRTFGPGLPIRVVMGGLRPGTEQAITPEARTEITTHWRHVHDAAGVPFDESVLADGFVYDTDPAARGVVVVRGEDEDLALPYLERVQRAFYAEARDVRDGEVLADLAAELGLDRQAFLDRWSTEAARHETWQDYGISQRAGVTGFPTLVAGPNAEGVFGVVTRGFAPADQVLGVLKDWIDRIAA